jgi:hypothetical protein
MRKLSKMVEQDMQERIVSNATATAATGGVVNTTPGLTSSSMHGGIAGTCPLESLKLDDQIAIIEGFLVRLNLPRFTTDYID